jgi:hypothetical protein
MTDFSGPATTKVMFTRRCHASTIICMNLRKLAIGSAVLFLYHFPAHAQSGACLDAAEEPHHRVLFDSRDVRVLVLELPRIASTEPHCHPHPYIYVVTGEGRSSSTSEGGATFSYDWNGPEARFVRNSVKRVIRNESGTTFREVIVETGRPLQFEPGQDSYDTDLFPLDLGSVKPTWDVSFTRGGVTAWKVQLAPGDNFPVDAADHLLIALTDVRLQQSGKDASAELSLEPQDIHLLPAGSHFTLTNTGSSARFILIEF